ncbi:MAG: hypothetical protein HWN69_04220 [Desulfobacterales bacterium]|nr:hypothetical protein [Desulfobacterales bacterium]
MDFRLENEIPMSARELWRILHTPEFDAFTAREYELRAYEELEKQVSDNLIHRRVRIITGTDLSYIPLGLAHKILGDNEIIYEEIQDIYLNRYEMHWKNKWIEPSLFKDKIRVSGMLRLIPIDECRCKRIREMSIRILIFGIGRILEGIAAEQAKKTSGKFSQVVDRWKSENAKCGRS